MKLFRAWCCVLWIALLSMPAAARPNIVVIVADDLGYADVLFNPLHAQEVTTPHLDALARQSVICRQGYVSGHVCSPTRTGLMTGRYQQRLGLYTAGEAGSGVPMSEKLFPQYLKPAGYVSCQIGKWHLGPTPEWSPALRGFDEVFGFLGRGAHDYFKLNDPDDPIYRGAKPAKVEGYLTDRWGDEAVAFIDRHKSQPFFLYLAFNAVHAPLQAPADEIARFNTGNTERNTLLAMGKRMDDAIGSVVAKLKSEKVWDNTLLFFISDNGGPLAQTAQNQPLRGGKHQDYEGGIRVPFLVCWPEQLKPGESNAVVSSLDFLPTALTAAGLTLPTDKPLDGRDILPILKGDQPAPSRDLFWCSGSEEGWWAVRSGDWKLVGEKARISLFDLSKDVSEKNDLSKSMPDKVAELTRLHDAWLAQLPNPVKAGAKRYGMESPAGSKPKKPKADRKKNTAPPPPPLTGVAPGTITHTFASLPGKPWKPQRGLWQPRDGGLWGSVKADDKQPALMRGPAIFTRGELACDFQFQGKVQHTLRLKDDAGNTLFRIDIAPDALTIMNASGEKNEILKKVPLQLSEGAWHRLSLTFNGPTLDGRFGDTAFSLTDQIVERPKSEVNFLISQGTIGLRNYSCKPGAGSKP